MQTECPHRKFCRLDATRDELSPQAAERFDSLALFDRLRLEGATEATALKAAGCSRATPCRWKRRLRCGDRGRKPGQMVQIDHTGVAIEAGFSVKESGAVCPVSKLCCMRACSRATAACALKLLDHLIRQAPFDIESVQVDGGSESAAEFETACRRRGIALFVLPPRSPICNGCVERANAAGRCGFHQSCAGELSVGALNVELAEFERFYNAYRPHQALGQRTPMQAYNENFDQSALAA